jgi:hypothetical protein
LGVSRSRVPSLKRQTGLIIAVALLVLVAGRPAGAAGCHVPDRPVLGTRLSWEIDPDPDFRGTREVQPPPVLTHPPCPGEVPHVLGSPSLTTALAHVDPVRLDGSRPAGFLRIADDPGRRDPLESRLDRPPRLRAGSPSFA